MSCISSQPTDTYTAVKTVQYACVSSIESKRHVRTAMSKSNPDFCQHIKNVLVMSVSLEHVNQSSHKPAAKLRMTPRLIAWTPYHVTAHYALCSLR